MQKLKAAITRFGMFKPIICRELKDGTLEILGGQHRWEAAQELEMTEVPVVNLGTVSTKTAKEIGLVDNGRYGEDDALQLGELLKEIGSPDEIAEFLPYSDGELASIFSASSIALEDLELDSDKGLSDLPIKAAPTHQVMRFSVPIGDADWITKMVESVMRTNGFTTEDSLQNAGNALVQICKSYRDAS
jgi:ParB family transcriptional regulator, chromosome partitioning protein